MVTFSHGNPVMEDYNATAAITAGDVMVVGVSVQVAHHDIASGDKGALGADGGVYIGPKATTSGTGWAHGAIVYWDASGSKFTATAGSNKKFGTAEGTAADSDATAKVLHIANNV